VRKVNADDKRQAAELIELDGGDWGEPVDTRKATFGVAAEAGRARTCAPTRGLLLGDAGAFGLRVLTLRRNEKSSALGALPPCGCDMVAS
jgi:hypothetical protein